MKTTSFILMLILAAQVVAGPKRERANDLNLTEEQQTQMQAVKQQQQEKLQLAREQIMAEGKAMMAEFLTAEQMAKIEQKQEQRKAQRGQGKGHKKMQGKGCREGRKSE